MTGTVPYAILLMAMKPSKSKEALMGFVDLQSSIVSPCILKE